MPDRVVADTSVISRLTKRGPDYEFYNRITSGRQLAVSFQTRAEFLAANYSTARQARLDQLLNDGVQLPHKWQTSLAYAQVAIIRKQLKRAQLVGGDASDGDVWVIAGAIEYFLPLLSHDAQQVALARAAGVLTFTNLPGLREENPVLA